MLRCNGRSRLVVAAIAAEYARNAVLEHVTGSADAVGTARFAGRARAAHRRRRRSGRALRPSGRSRAGVAWAAQARRAQPEDRALLAQREIRIVDDVARMRKSARAGSSNASRSNGPSLRRLRGMEVPWHFGCVVFRVRALRMRGRLDFFKCVERRRRFSRRRRNVQVLARRTFCVVLNHS